MPELPEVETIKSALKKHLLNRKIKYVDVLYKRMILTPLDDFINNLQNVTILDITRKGKYLIFLLSNNRVLISHLRMEGKYLYFSDDQENTIHARVVFHLDNNEKVIYDDSRCFGIMELHYKEDYLSAQCLAKLGPEPFDCDGEYLFKQIKSKHKEIKSVILDQSILSGLGNIYADETLFACKINPFAPANSLSLNDCTNIIENARRILLMAISRGGSTVSSYHPENGVDGKFQNELLAYGKSGKSCSNCGQTLLKDFCNGRGTVYCPHCQHVSKRIGIYGKIASGKSTICQFFVSRGYKTFSCDKYINKLYNDSLLLKKGVIDIFGEAVINDDGKISKAYIKNQIILNSQVKKQLEQLIHPLVKKGIEEFIHQTKLEEIVFIEVPLLFESKFNKLVDYIIGVDSSYEIQIRNLLNRGSTTPQIDLDLNSSNKFDKYASKCDYLIHNNGSIDDLYNQCNIILDKIKKS